MQIEFFLLIISILFFVSIIVSKISSRFGVPVLLLFLAVGMLFGVDGLGIQFENIRVAQIIGTISLCIILFSGGMDTRIADIRPVLGAGITLATLGVFTTALCTGLIIWLLMDNLGVGINIGLLGSLLLAATMSSTDSASVFSILRSNSLHLKNGLKPMLELESGSNDPMAYILTITLMDLLKQGGNPHYGTAFLMLLIQLIVGALAGYLLGKGLVWLINRLKIENTSLYPILSLTACVFIFSVTYFLQGNSYLAVYIGGLVFGNSSFVHKRSTRNFFDGLSWLGQLVMFLTLGLLVNPSELHWKTVVLPGLIISLVMIFFSRPLSVFVSLIPFRRYNFRDKIFVSWCGLRGAVPIIFAILCRAENIPHADVIFNMVFFCTLVSLVLQGTTLPWMARRMQIAEDVEEKNKILNFDIDFPEEIKSAASEIELSERALQNGNLLMNLKMPEKTLVIMIKRGEMFFVPTGKTKLFVGDRLMVLSDNEEELKQTLKNLGV